MRAWLAPAGEALERGEAAMLVHVAELKGSGPREAGAQMLVTESAIVGTIGGGELEHTAMLKARELLQSGRRGAVRLALGPELNQCCGGSVTLAFEPFAPADLAWVSKLIARRRGADADRPHACSFDESGRLAPRLERAGTGERDADFRGDASPSEAASIIRERINPPAAGALAVRRRACRPRGRATRSRRSASP